MTTHCTVYLSIPVFKLKGDLKGQQVVWVQRLLQVAVPHAANVATIVQPVAFPILLLHGKHDKAHPLHPNCGIKEPYALPD